MQNSPNGTEDSCMRNSVHVSLAILDAHLAIVDAHHNRR